MQARSDATGIRPLQVAAGVIKNAQGQILIALRHAKSHQGGLWEFPGGKIESGETPEQALKRELKEELDISVAKAKPLISVSYQYPELLVQLHVFLVEDFSGQVKSGEGQPILWVMAEDLPRYAFPAANQPIIKAAQLPAHYAILDDADSDQLWANLLKILNSDVKLIQARLKRLTQEAVHDFLIRAYPLCKRNNAILLVNSAVKLADLNAVHDINSVDRGGYELLADGIHMTSAHLWACTRRPKNIRWLAASCHTREELQQAEKIGADFAVLAPVLATSTHPETEPLGWERFRQLVLDVNLPVYALGGMTQDCLSAAQHAGGQGIAGISAFL